MTTCPKCNAKAVLLKNDSESSFYRCSQSSDHDFKTSLAETLKKVPVQLLKKGIRI